MSYKIYKNGQLVTIAGSAIMDAQLDSNSTNGIQNKVVTAAINQINSNLTANNNKFIFAYDSTSQSYGYKAGGADTFHPFKSGAQLLGTYNGHTIDISSDYGNYKNITVDNILIVPASMQARVYTYANGNRPWSYNTQDISYTYNSSTGVITITNDVLSANDGCSLCYAEIMSYKVYII